MLVFFGGSYGSVWAFACAANAPPDAATRIEPASCIRGLLVMGSFSPFAEHAGHTEGMSWVNWLTVSWPGLWPPLSWIHPTVGRLIRWKVAGNVDASIGMLRKILTGPGAMTPQERAAMEQWCVANGTTFAAWERNMAKGMALSVLHTLDGYNSVPAILNSDWGFRLSDIHILQTVPAVPVLHAVPAALPAVVVAGALRDHLAPLAMGRWVATQIPGAQMLELEGNHISAITELNSIIAAMLNGLLA
jgi:hypothetical protein